MALMVLDLIDKYKLVSDQVDKSELRVILTELEKALRKSDGNVVEFGCYAGTTSLFIRRVMDKLGSMGDFHVYDSFEGLPEKTNYDKSPVGETFKAGALKFSKKNYIINFKKAGLKTPFIHKGWFSMLTQDDIPKNIIFAYLDGDYYDSITGSLRMIWNDLLPEAVIVIDDYNSEALPGVKRAVDDWAIRHDFSLRSEKSLAILSLNKQ